jgi:hypothetical protein
VTKKGNAVVFVSLDDITGNVVLKFHKKGDPDNTAYLDMTKEDAIKVAETLKRAASS